MIIKIKSNDVIRDLTRLCALAGWEACNVATKYLKIIAYSLQASSKNDVSTDSIDIYEIISKAMEDIYKILLDKIAQQSGEIVYEDRQMFNQLAVCGSLICMQIPSIPLSKITTVAQSATTHIIIRERSPQEKGIELLLENLIKPSLLESFIETLLHDMEKSFQMTQ